MTKTVAVTGASGFIGKHIVEKLLSRNFFVRGLSRTLRTDSNQNLTWVHGSLEDQHSLSELVRGADYVVHCAGQVRGHKEEIFTQCNVAGSLRLMQAAKESGCCERFLFISSLAARYPHLSWYAHSKYVAEQNLSAMVSDFSFGIFRPTAVYGPGDKELKPVFNWLLRGILPQTGTAESQLSFIHVTDLAEAVFHWLIAGSGKADPFELCDGMPGGYNWLRLKEIGTLIRDAPVRLIRVPLPLLNLAASLNTVTRHVARQEPMLTRSKIRELTHADWSASNKRVSEYTGWAPAIRLERALREGLF